VSELRLADIIAPGLDLLFVGFNPSVYSAIHGHFYARPGNRFWILLALAGLTPRRYAPEEDRTLLDLGIGITDLCPIPTPGIADLPRAVAESGRGALTAKIEAYAPRIVSFNGRATYERFFGRALAGWGAQPTDRIGYRAEPCLRHPFLLGPCQRGRSGARGSVSGVGGVGAGIGARVGCVHKLSLRARDTLSTADSTVLSRCKLPKERICHKVALSTARLLILCARALAGGFTGLFLVLLWIGPAMACGIAMAFAQQRYLRAYREHHHLDRTELPLVGDLSATALVVQSSIKRTARVWRAYREHQSDPELERLRGRIWLYFGLSAAWSWGIWLLLVIAMFAW
jgi:TDG/mug DNA glycosylase family protein